jgi:hypothetical protein
MRVCSVNYDVARQSFTQATAYRNASYTPIIIIFINSSLVHWLMAEFSMLSGKGLASITHGGVTRPDRSYRWCPRTI